MTGIMAAAKEIAQAIAVTQRSSAGHTKPPMSKELSSCSIQPINAVNPCPTATPIIADMMPSQKASPTNSAAFFAGVAPSILKIARPYRRSRTAFHSAVNTLKPAICGKTPDSAHLWSCYRTSFCKDFVKLICVLGQSRSFFMEPSYAASNIN